MYTIPVLVIVFNRLETAKKSFECIRKIQPKYLYVASDGPRIGYRDDVEKINAVRVEILNSIDWDCEVKTLFQAQNLGCGIGVYTAINWFFKNVDYGIIMEDDCIVDSSFWEFMNEMLLRYKSDKRIGMVAGSNPISFSDYSYSYTFSRYKSCWGWGTWRRAWENMDINMNWRNEISQSVLLNSGYCGKDIVGWKYKLKCIDKKVVSAWDWQWYFSLSAQNQLCIYPKVNLVSNIGNGVDATHTAFGNILIQCQSLEFPLVHPQYVLPCSSFDRRFYSYSNSFKIKFLRIMPIKLKKILKVIIYKYFNICPK